MTNSTFRKFCLAAALSLCLSASVVQAAELQAISIKQQTSHYMNMGQLITRIAVGNPDIATVIQLPGSASEFLIVTKKNPGSTSLFVWTRDGARHEYMIVVSPEDPGRAMLIEQAIGLPDVHVKMVDNRILLTGTVENQYQKNYALQTARLFVNSSSESSLLVGSGFDMKLKTNSATNASEGRSGELNVAQQAEAKGEIIDLIQILHPTQIRLEAQIIEINSDDAKNLGLRYGEDPVNSPGIFAFGEDYARTSTPIPFSNNPLRWIGQHFAPINVSLSLLVQQQKARILSRPSITTLSGEQATIQIGGQIPYTSTNANGTKTDFKNFGIILQFKPVVDAQHRINSIIHAEVSNLSGEYVNGEPIISTRSADSVISLNSGMPIVIGGLMDSSETKTVQKIPLLGDIPILGEFFKHTSKSRDKRELIIIVTPHIVGEDERTQTSVSQTMLDWMYQERQYRNAMNDFDFAKPNFDNATEEQKRRKKAEQAAQKAKETGRPFSGNDNR